MDAWTVLAFVLIAVGAGGLAAIAIVVWTVNAQRKPLTDVRDVYEAQQRDPYPDSYTMGPKGTKLHSQLVADSHERNRLADERAKP